MALPNGSWEVMEGFISQPGWTLIHTDDRVGELEDVAAWGRKNPRWKVEALDFSWDALAAGETREAREVSHTYLETAVKLSAKEMIPKKSYHTYQDQRYEQDYLEHLEVLRRAQVLRPSHAGIIMMAVGKETEVLRDVGQVLLPGTHVQVFRADTLGFIADVSDSPKDRIERATSKLCALKEDGVVFKSKADVVWANCIEERSIAEGSLSEEKAYEENKKICFSVALAIRMLQTEGSLIIETHGFQDGFFVSCVYLLCRFFEHVSFLKPLASLDSEMRIYLIAKSYDPHSNVALQERLNGAIDAVMLMNPRTGSFPLGKDNFPADFLEKFSVALDPVFRHVACSKLRNAAYLVDNSCVDLGQVQRYQISTATEWVLQLQLEDVYYARR